MSLRRITSIGVLIVAGLASLATSPGLPTVTRDLSGHAAFMGDGSTLIDLHVAVAPQAAGNASDVSLQLRSTQFGQASPFELEARLSRAPGPEGPAGWSDSGGRLTGSDWQQLPSYWTSDGVTCAANVECALDFQVEFRPTVVLLREQSVPWHLTVSVSPVSSYDWVSVASSSSSAPPAPSMLALLAIGIGAVVAALAYLVLRRGLRVPNGALRLSEIGVALFAAIVGALSLLSSQGTGTDETRILLVGAALVALFVAVRRPPGTTPRATVAVFGMLLLPTSPMAYQTAAAVEPWDVILVNLPIGALVAVGAIGLATPRSWWASQLQKPGFRNATLATGALVATLLAASVAAAVTATHPDAVPSVAALFAVWVLLAYREWTESSTRALRAAGIALAILGILGALGVARCSESPLLAGNPAPPVPVVPIAISGVVAALGILVAAKGGRRLEPWSRPVEGGRRT